MKTVVLDHVCNFEKGATGLAKAESGKYPLVTTGADRKLCSTYQFDTKAVCIPLVSSTGHGHASLKNVHYQEGKFALGSILVALTAKDQSILDIQFLHLYLSQLKDQILVPLMSGAANVALSVAKIKKIKLPLPSIDRQKEIVSRFKSITQEEVNLKEELSHQSIILRKLRQQILQDAVEGKLTEKWRVANPNVEPASKLLKRIAEEKEQLIKSGKIKKQKPLPIITEEDKPFTLPKSWEWCRLGSVANGFQYGTSSKSLDAGKVPVLRMGNIQNGKILWNNLVYTNDSSEISKFRLESGDLLFNRTNSRELVGKTAIYEENTEAIYAGYLVRFRPFYDISSRYCNIVMNSKLHSEWCNEVKTDAIGQSNINATKLSLFRFPLPPIPEQHAIAAKINELFAICDQLEEKITQNQAYADQLMQSVLKEAFTQKADAPVTTNNIVEFKAKSKQTDYYKRTLLAAEIVNELHKEPTLGHLKLQKIIFLCQKVHNMNLPTNFLQQAAGPYDPQMARSIDKQLQEKQWFSYNKAASLKYQPLSQKGAHKNDFQKYFQNELSDISYIISLFRKTTSTEIEAIATLYACWENILDNGITFAKSTLIEKFYNWSEEKRKFSERQLNEVITWMEKNNIYPNYSNKYKI